MCLHGGRGLVFLAQVLLYVAELPDETLKCHGVPQAVHFMLRDFVEPHPRSFIWEKYLSIMLLSEECSVYSVFMGMCLSLPFWVFFFYEREVEYERVNEYVQDQVTDLKREIFTVQEAEGQRSSAADPSKSRTENIAGQRMPGPRPCDY